MDFGVLFLWGSDGLCGAFFVGVRWTLGCFVCGGQMDFGVLFLWGSDGLWGAFFVGVRWTLPCFFCGGQMDFAVLFLWGSDGLWGAFFVGVRWTLRCFFLAPVLNRQGFHLSWLFEACHYAGFLPWAELLTSNFVTCWKFFPLNFSAVCCLLCVDAAVG